LLRVPKDDADYELQSEREVEIWASFVEPSLQSGIRRESRSNLEVMEDRFEGTIAQQQRERDETKRAAMALHRFNFKRENVCLNFGFAKNLSSLSRKGRELQMN
jgi:hypothetical protein